MISRRIRTANRADLTPDELLQLRQYHRELRHKRTGQPTRTYKPTGQYRQTGKYTDKEFEIQYGFNRRKEQRERRAAGWYEMTPKEKAAQLNAYNFIQWRSNRGVENSEWTDPDC